MSGPRMTLSTQLVLRVFLQDTAAPRYGLEIGEAAGLATGTVHPILARLEHLGWLESSWEDVDPHEAARPARRYYQLTAAGATSPRTGVARVVRGRRLSGRVAGAST